MRGINRITRTRTSKQSRLPARAGRHRGNQSVLDTQRGELRSIAREYAPGTRHSVPHAGCGQGGNRNLSLPGFPWAAFTVPRRPEKLPREQRRPLVGSQCQQRSCGLQRRAWPHLVTQWRQRMAQGVQHFGVAPRGCSVQRDPWVPKATLALDRASSRVLRPRRGSCISNKRRSCRLTFVRQGDRS